MDKSTRISFTWKYVVVLFVVIGLLLSSMYPMTVLAAPAASLSGPSGIRAGQTIQIDFHLSGENIQGALGTIRFDPNQLTYVRAENILSGWESTAFNPGSGNIIFVGAGSGSPITGTQRLFRMVFTLRTDIAVGTVVSIQAADLSTSDGVSDADLANAVYSVTILPPLSTNNNLGSLTISNATITPAFSPSVVNYSATVPFTVSRLAITAAAADAKAAVNLNNPALAVGTTAVRITVTSESGSARTYTIQVTRQQDPQYQASGNAKLRSLTPSIGILSPVFDADTTDYVVYLPAEAVRFSASGAAQDTRAQKVEAGEITLIPGANLYEVIVTAENGEKQTYRVTVMKMPSIAQMGSLTPGTDSGISADESQMPSDYSFPEGAVRNSGVSRTGAILLAVWTFIVGGILAYLFAKKRFTDE